MIDHEPSRTTNLGTPTAATSFVSSSSDVHTGTSSNKITQSRLSKAIGCGSNPKRVREMIKRRRNSSFQNIIAERHLMPPRKMRKDKMSGDPVFTAMWHHVCQCHKGQAEVSKCLESKKFKINDKYRTESKWTRHQLRVMEGKAEEIFTEALKFEPYLEWRDKYIKRCA